MEGPYKLQRPKDLEDYILRVVADNTYLIFNRKKDTCRCTRCGSWNKISDLTGTYLSHNGKSHCPNCGAEAICKEERYGRKNITEYGRILWFRKNKSVTFAQLDEYQIDYTGMCPKVIFWPSVQYKFSKKEQHYFKHIPEGYWMPERWEERKRIRLPAATSGMWNYYKVPRYQKTVTHTSWINGKGSDLKYANFNMQRLGCTDPDNPYMLIGYITNFLKYQSIELLEKAGFEKIVGEKANEQTTRYINWKGKDLRKILKMNNAEIKAFRNEKPAIHEIECYQILKKKGVRLCPQDLKMFRAYNMSETIDKVKRFVDINKAVKYLKCQKRFYLSIYADYLDECDRLGFDMSRKNILFPKDLQTAHEKTSQQIRINADKIVEQNFLKQTKRIYPEDMFQSGSYLIRAAQSSQELAEESKALRHCVRTYTNRVADGRCAILFIRTVKEPDKPFFTLELSPDRTIVQCRGYQNCSYPEDIAEFLSIWKKEVLEKLRKMKAVPAA